ncbi:MAG: ArsC/Spx/MgsR family protein [Planctomycetota bacterium]
MRYLDEPPAADELDAICQALDQEPTAIVRTKENRFVELGLSLDEKRSRAEWLQLLAENPSLIERPIVCVGSGEAMRCVVGRPPERIAKLFAGE